MSGLHRQSEVQAFIRLMAKPFTTDELLDGVDAKRAVALFTRGARAGDGDAQVMLGYCFEIGKGVRASKSRALFWYRRAARAGNAAAASNIGTIFRDEGDSRSALRWFRRAVALGLPEALLEIAKLQRTQTTRARARSSSSSASGP